MSSPPKPASEGALQGDQNQANQAANQISAQSSNYTTPYGGLNYDVNGNNITANSTYSPQEQSLFNFMTGQIQPGALQGAGGALQDFENQTGGTGSPNIVGAGNNLAQQYAAQATQAVEPNMAWMIQNNQNQLANEGLFESTNTQTPDNAADRSMQNMYAGLGQSIAGFQSQLLPQATQAEETQNFTNPMQAIQSLMQEGAPIGLPTTVGAPNMAPNAMNAVTAQNQAYNQQAQQFGSTVGGVGQGLGMLASMFGS